MNFPSPLISKESILYTIDFPSGKVVCDDSLREVIDYDLIKGYDINKRDDLALYTLEFPKLGQAHGFCGNSCPELYLDTINNIYYICNFNEDGTDEEPDPEWGGGYMAKPEGFESLGHFCTDLWWWSIMDLGLFKDRGGEISANSCRWAMDLIPGSYFFEILGENPELYKRNVFARFRKIDLKVMAGKPTLCEDFWLYKYMDQQNELVVTQARANRLRWAIASERDPYSIMVKTFFPDIFGALQSNEEGVA